MQEGYYIFREGSAPADGKDDGARPLSGPNQWPSEEVVPGWVKQEPTSARVHSEPLSYCAPISQGFFLCLLL